MKFNLIILCIIGLLLLSCSSSKFLTSYQNYPKIGLDLNPIAIQVKDIRENVNRGDIKIPSVSQNGQYEIATLPLKSEHEKIIRQTVLENIKSSSLNSSILIIEILNASKEFSAAKWAEKETAFVNLKITAKVNEREIVITESGEFFKKSLDASSKSSERIFKKTIKEVTYNALKKLGKEISG